MGVTLTRSTAAAFPDRPGAGVRHGLRLTMVGGAGTAWLTRGLPAPQNRLHVRAMISLGTLAGGPVTVLQGRDHASQVVWSVELDAAAQTVTLHVGGQALALDVSDTLAWKCIEIALDALAGTAQIILNGVTAEAEAQSGLSFAATASIRLGAPARHADATGLVDLDEIRVATTMVGPLLLPAQLPHAGDARRWLLLYNRDVADSVSVAEQYRAARSLPHANCLGLPLGTSETLASSAALALLDQIHGYLAGVKLAAQIRGVLLCHRVPGLVDSGRSLASLIAGTANPDYTAGATLPARSALATANRLVAEIDCPTVAQALLRTTRAAALGESRLDGTVLSTLRADRDQVMFNAGAWTGLAAFAGTLDAQQLRLPVAAATTAHGHALEFTASTAGSVTLTTQLKALLVCGADGGASTLRSSASLAGTAIAGGYAAVLGFAGASGDRLSVLSFTTALRAGWTLAEAVRALCPRSMAPGVWLPIRWPSCLCRAAVTSCTCVRRPARRKPWSAWPRPRPAP